MKAMILAAGRGQRLRPLTDTTPKPLLKVGGKPLIEYHLEKLSQAGITEVIINIAYLGEKIRHALGDGSRWQLKIDYSVEPQPLETAGAVHHALPLLGKQPFLLINSDIWTDYPLINCLKRPLGANLGHLVLVDNPPHHPAGDYSIYNQRLIAKQHRSYTFSGISILSPDLIRCYPDRRNTFALREVFQFSLEKNHLSAEYYSGQWWDIGTPERLDQVNQLAGP